MEELEKPTSSSSKTTDDGAYGKRLRPRLHNNVAVHDAGLLLDGCSAQRRFRAHLPAPVPKKRVGEEAMSYLSEEEIKHPRDGYEGMQIELGLAHTTTAGYSELKNAFYEPANNDQIDHFLKTGLKGLNKKKPYSKQALKRGISEEDGGYHSWRIRWRHLPSNVECHVPNNQ
ncbi:hypothetical protein Cgig2_027179 [Carnegiea gigantea]|uniref:Uncharacterized protein n=1 Tax=Carnegiea gigantea TaxID=171969 RepID=A0A9Q1KV40_9CARY|nr:hypothetical protein Cgig2_027179 [Carnegiea gigantea]